MIIKRSVVYVVFTWVFSLMGAAFAQDGGVTILPEKSGNILIENRLWGVRWNALGFDTKCTSVNESNVYIGFRHEGWSDWRLTNIHLVVSQKLIEVEEIEAETWASLEGYAENFPAVFERKMYPAVGLGLRFNVNDLAGLDSLRFIGVFQISEGVWFWSSKVVLSKGRNSVEVEFGRLRNFQGWGAEYCYRVAANSVFFRFEGVNPSFSAGIKLPVGGLELELRQRQRVLGGSSEVGVEW